MRLQSTCPITVQTVKLTPQCCYVSLASYPCTLHQGQMAGGRRGGEGSERDTLCMLPKTTCTVEFPSSGCCSRGVLHLVGWLTVHQWVLSFMPLPALCFVPSWTSWQTQSQTGGQWVVDRVSQTSHTHFMTTTWPSADRQGIPVCE